MGAYRKAGSRLDRRVSSGLRENAFPVRASSPSALNRSPVRGGAGSRTLAGWVCLPALQWTSAEREAIKESKNRDKLFAQVVGHLQILPRQKR
jgi:hypothetical protein